MTMLVPELAAAVLEALEPEPVALTFRVEASDTHTERVNHTNHVSTPRSYGGKDQNSLDVASVPVCGNVEVVAELPGVAVPLVATVLLLLYTTKLDEEAVPLESAAVWLA